MLTYRVGSGGSASGAKLAKYYQTSDNVPEMQQKMAGYYVTPSADISSHAVPDRNMDELISSRLGIDPQRPLTQDELANLLSGKRTDGSEIEGKRKSQNSFIDMTFSAPKSFSVALVLAPTDAERKALDKAHTDAVEWITDHIAKQIGTASIGDNTGNLNPNRRREPAHIARIYVEHYTARPTDKIPLTDDTRLFTSGKGDPQRHTHVLIPNISVTAEGRATALHQDGLRQRIHEWGSLYQARLGVNLRKLGVNTELDSTPRLSFNERMLRLTDVPPERCELFSKRAVHANNAARDLARDMGVDFDALSAGDKSEWLGRSANEQRQPKDTIGGEYESWLQQAKDAGYNHRSVLRPGQEKTLRPAAERHHQAFDVALPMLNEQFQRRAVLEGSIPRIAAAKGFIEAGIESADEVNAVTAAMRSEGVVHNGQKTELHWDMGKDRFARVTTQLSVEMENEAIGLLRAAASDTSVALSPGAIKRAVAKVSARDGLDFTTEHGLKQRAFIDKIASQGRAAVGVGVAGSGKSAALRPLIEAWHEAGQTSYGVTLAWRQTQGLKDAGVGRAKHAGKRKWEANTDTLVEAGVDAEKAMALHPFLKRVTEGKINLDAKSTVIIDEIALVGTKQMLELARLQAKHGFHLVGIGDDLQCQSIDAGATIDLARRAFGTDNVPELLSSTRQLTERDRVTASLWREGKADEALARKDLDGTLRIVPGGHAEAVKATADLWWERKQANAGVAGYSLGISVPTNADGRAVGSAIRDLRRRAGQIGPDLLQLDACDQNGEAYSLRIARGDKVRLFDRVRGRNADGRYSIAGNNGTVVEVLSADYAGMTVRKGSDKVATIAWDALRKDGSPIRLSYGDAVTIDARQSDTVTEHITSMPNGSSGVNGFKAYTAESRHRVAAWLVTSQGAEKQEIQQRRPLGDPRNQETDTAKVKEAVLANMARNLSNQDKKTLAVDFMDQARNLRSGRVDSQEATWHRPAMEEMQPAAFTAQPWPAPRVVDTPEVAATNVVKTPEEVLAAAVAAGDVSYERAIERLMDYWEQDNPEPSADIRREQWMATGSDPIDQWQEQRMEAELTIAHRILTLVDEFGSENNSAEADNAAHLPTVTQAARDNARASANALMIDDSVMQQYQQQRDMDRGMEQ